MAITQERMDLLNAYLAENEARADELFELSAEEAAAKINADGYNFTAEELSAFSEEVAKAAGDQNGELGEDELENVAGGCRIPTWVILRGAVFLAWWLKKHPWFRR